MLDDRVPCILWCNTLRISYKTTTCQNGDNSFLSHQSVECILRQDKHIHISNTRQDMSSRISRWNRVVTIEIETIIASNSHFVKGWFKKKKSIDIY